MRWLLALALVAGCDRLLGLDHLSPLPIDAPPSPFDSLDDGLEAWYRFEDATWKDSTNHHHDGACVKCPTIVAGQIGNAAHFDGTQLISVVDDSRLTLQGAFTIAAWVSPDSTGAGISGTVASKVYGTSFDNTWQLHTNMTSVEFYMIADHLTAGNVLVAQQWVHVAIRFDGSSRSIIVGGVEKALDQSVTDYDQHDLVIGGDKDCGIPVTMFTGRIDELRVYSRAVDTAELAALVQLR